MVSRGDATIVLWPRYFDARLSRAEGRRVPAKLAVKDPDAQWVEAAARKAGLKPTLEEKAADPRVPYKVVGRVLVEKDGSKEAAIRVVAQKMTEGK